MFSFAKLGFIASTGVGLAVVGYAYWYYRKRTFGQGNEEPKYWRKVGELSDLFCYPIKSCSPIRLTEVECSILGLQKGYLRDRTFMIMSSKNVFVTGRQHPKLVLVQPKLDGKYMKISAPGMRDINIDIEKLYSLKTIKVEVWGQTVDAVDCGDEVARWLSRYTLSEDSGLRLGFYPKDLAERDVRERNKIFDTMVKEDSGAFHDATSFMLFNESSLIDLNSRLENPVTVLNFRPNLVVRGPLAYEEDYWKWVKIGNNVVFRNIKPCTRCIFTNVNPQNGIRSPDGNVLNELKTYRKFPKTGESPVLGTHLGLRKSGKINIGDSVYVECNY